MTTGKPSCIDFTAAKDEDEEEDEDENEEEKVTNSKHIHGKCASHDIML